MRVIIAAALGLVVSGCTASSSDRLDYRHYQHRHYQQWQHHNYNHHYHRHQNQRAPLTYYNDYHRPPICYWRSTERGVVKICR